MFVPKVSDALQHCKVKFKSVDATELSAREWEQFSKLKAFAPTAQFVLREHHAQCERGEPLMKRGVIVKFQVENLTFKREFALTPVQS